MTYFNEKIETDRQTGQNRTHKDSNRNKDSRNERGLGLFRPLCVTSVTKSALVCNDLMRAIITAPCKMSIID